MAGTLCPSARTSPLALVTAEKLASAITSSSPCPIWAIRYKSSGERMLGMRFNMVFFLDRGVILARVAPRDPRPGEATGDALHDRGSRAAWNVSPVARTMQRSE